jgi:hypothetical protein
LALFLYLGKYRLNELLKSGAKHINNSPDSHHRLSVLVYLCRCFLLDQYVSHKAWHDLSMVKDFPPPGTLAESEVVPMRLPDYIQKYPRMKFFDGQTAKEQG